MVAGSTPIPGFSAHITVWDEPSISLTSIKKENAGDISAVAG